MRKDVLPSVRFLFKAHSLSIFASFKTKASFESTYPGPSHALDFGLQKCEMKLILLNFIRFRLSDDNGPEDKDRLSFSFALSISLSYSLWHSEPSAFGFACLLKTRSTKVAAFPFCHL